MDKRLKNLKNVMKRKTLNNLKFTDEHMENVKSRINTPYESDEHICRAVMQLLLKEKTGYELAKQLRSRGIKKFEDNEGFLYTVLHRLEQKGYLMAAWNMDKVKHYKLNDKGKRMLAKVEKSSENNRTVLDVLTEVRVQ